MLKEYICHKVVQAAKIEDITTERRPDGATWVNGSIQVKPDYLSKHKPEIGGYYVLYQDGYESYSPALAFESGYSLADSAEEEAHRPGYQPIKVPNATMTPPGHE